MNEYKILAECIELLVKNMHTHHSASANYDEFNKDMERLKRLTAELRDAGKQEINDEL